MKVARTLTVLLGLVALVVMTGLTLVLVFAELSYLADDMEADHLAIGQLCARHAEGGRQVHHQSVDLTVLQRLRGDRVVVEDRDLLGRRDDGLDGLQAGGAVHRAQLRVLDRRHRAGAADR